MNHVNTIIIILIISILVWIIYTVVNELLYSNILNNCKVVISTTTIPSRVKYLNNIIDNMYKQTFKANNFYINIPYVSKRFNKSYPGNLNHIDTKNGWVKINRCEDYGPATKLLGCINKISDKNAIIITVDDDQLYSKDTIRNLAINSIKHPSKVLCTKIYPHLSLNGKKINTLEGFGGVAYKRKFITPYWIDLINTMPKDCFLSDDVIFTYLLYIQKTPIKRVNIKENRIDNDIVSKTSPLYLENRKSVYKNCIRYLNNLYNIYMSR